MPSLRPRSNRQIDDLGVLQLTKIAATLKSVHNRKFVPHRANLGPYQTNSCHIELPFRFAILNPLGRAMRLLVFGKTYRTQTIPSNDKAAACSLTRLREPSAKVKRFRRFTANSTQEATRRSALLRRRARSPLRPVSLTRRSPCWSWCPAKTPPRTSRVRSHRT